MAAVAVVSMPAPAEVDWQANGVGVCTVVNPQESPYVVSLATGGAIVVWADTRDFDYDIYAQRLDANGNPLWAPGGANVCGADYDQQFPVAVEDGSGGAVIVWQDGRLGDDGLALYAQKVLPDGSMAWQDDGVPVCSYAVGLEDPPLAFSHVAVRDGSGGVITVWRDTRNDPVLGNTEIYAQKLDANGTPIWTVNGLPILAFDARKWSTRNPVIAADGSGGAIVVWQDARNLSATSNDLYAQHVAASGSVTWTPNGVVVCDAVGDQGYPDIVALDPGAIVTVWEDKRSGNYDVYAQKLDASGIPGWGANGCLICSSANDQRTPRVCADGHAGVVVAWTDKRESVLHTDVYAQRLDGSGAALWGEQGTPICTAAGSQTRIRMAPSVPGYTLLTWMDTRNETLTATYDIYGQMIDSAAVPRWSLAGIPVGAITGTNQRLQQAVGDCGGCLYAVWEDDRNAGDWDIYAQKLVPWIPVQSIAEARSQSAGTPVLLPARVVTGSFQGFLYVEEESRCAGIRIDWPDAFPLGSTVKVYGTVGSGPEPSIAASAVDCLGSDDVPAAFGITPSRLGGAVVGTVPGLTNVGLLVRTWGKIAEFDTATPRTWFRIDDGSGVNVKCVVPDDVMIDPGWQWVGVTGISSCEKVGDELHRLLRVRQQSDITPF